MINNHILEVKINVIKFKDIGKAPSYPYLGLHLVKDLLEINPAVDMLIRILDTRRIRTFAQFYTFRSSWSYFSIVWKDSIKGVL